MKKHSFQVLFERKIAVKVSLGEIHGNLITIKNQKILDWL